MSVSALKIYLYKFLFYKQNTGINYGHIMAIQNELQFLFYNLKNVAHNNKTYGIKYAKTSDAIQPTGSKEKQSRFR